jgi:serine/threonine protein kinase
MEQHDFALDPARWATLRRLLDEALERDPSQRAAWLDSLDGPLAEFKPRLRALLEQDAATSHRRMHTLPKVETADFASTPLDSMPERIGPYRLLRELGSGGMASVWLAERTDMLQGRQVALKLPHGDWGAFGARGASRRAGLVERLAREREILATLNHPNIARLYDAGVADDGQPYLALEYVEGERIDAYCARHQLDVPARLRLFMQAARAVAHAHANLVVHRDLKPSNILVNAQGDVRLLDFGIAKLLDQGQAEETELTQQAGRALTPDYASPEQIRGEAIGTASDVYSLGVVLYELLTGVRPYRLEHASRAALEAGILRAAPLRPSDSTDDPRLKRALRGDLDTIIGMALKKLQSDRYATVDAMAADVARHLEHRAVLAQPDSRMYRLTRLIRRNRVAVGAATAVAASLVIGSSLALWQMLEAIAQRDNAARQQQSAIASNEFLKQLLEDVGASGKPRTLVDTLDRSVAMLEQQYEGNEHGSARLLLQASIIMGTLGKPDRMLQLLDRVSASATRLGDAELLAEVECYAASSLLDKDLPRAKARYAAGREAQVRVPRASGDVAITCDRAQAWLQASDGDPAGAIAAFERILERYGTDPAMSVGTRHSLLSDIGILHFRADNTAGAIAATERSLQLLDDAGRGRSLSKILSMINLAAILARGGEVLAASRRQEEAIALLRQVEPDGELPPGYAGHLAASFVRLARYDEALSLAKEDAARSHRAGNTRFAALSELLAARSLVKLRRFDESEEILARAESGLRANPKGNQRMLNEVELTRADGHLLQGELERARHLVDSVLERLGYPVRTDAAGLGSALYTGARVALAQGDPGVAERQAADAIVIAARVARNKSQSADVGQASLHRAQALFALGRVAEATPLAQEAHASLNAGFGLDHPETLDALRLVTEARAAGAGGRPQPAASAAR